MRHSESLDKIAPALVKFQAGVGNPGKDATNPHYRNRYTSLDALLIHIRKEMAANGLAQFQSTETRESDGRTGCRTMILHSSGQWIEGDAVYLKDRKDDAQGAGSCITYARRYSLLAALGLAPSDDDDGHAASTPPPRREPERVLTQMDAQVPQYDDWETAIDGASSVDELRDLFQQMPAQAKAALKDRMAKRKRELA